MTLLTTLRALTMLSLCLLPDFANATDSAAKSKKDKVEKVASAPVSALSANDLASTEATVVLTGRIRNEQGQPLAAATVYLQGSSVAVTTNEQGLFTLEVPAAGKKILRYGYGGYQDRDVVVTSSAPLTMSLQPSPAERKK